MDSRLLSLPPLDAIRGFVAVGRRLSITLAAQDICLTQSAVSRQIQALEEYFGKPLLIRKHRSIALTDTGEKLFQLADPWFERIANFSRTIKEEARPHPVTISSSLGVAGLWLLPRMGKFQSLHPQMDIRVMASNQILDFKQDGIDLAIRYCREAQAPKHAVRLFDEVVVPVASKTVATQAFKNHAALLSQTFLEYDDRARPWLRWADWLSAIGHAHDAPKSYLRFNQYDQLIAAAIDGQGVALGRLGLVQPMLQDGRLVAQPDARGGVSDFSYWLVQDEGTPRTDVQLFREWILNEASLTAAALQTILNQGGGKSGALQLSQP